MGTKNKPGKYDCYANAHPDEPMFVLLGRDPEAPALVEEWANGRELLEGRTEKVLEARACAEAMREWAKRGTSAVRVVVNGRELDLSPAAELTYRTIVDLAGKNGSPTVTWRSRSGNTGGEMTDGDGHSIVPSEGLVFNVVHTGNA